MRHEHPHERYRDLARAVHVSLGVPFPGDGPGDGNGVYRLELDGLVFDLCREPLRDARNLVVLCRLGSVGTACATASLTHLLELNFILAMQQRGTTLAVDPDSGEVVCRFEGNLGLVTPASVLGSVRSSARLMAAWRRGAFADDVLSATAARATAGLHA